MFINYADDIKKAGKYLFDKSFVAANDGNISVKIAEDQILITCTGISKGAISEDDIVRMDMAGRVLSGSRKPSQEYRMHLKIYESRLDVCAIVHAHPPKATAFAVAGLGIDKVSLPEVILSLGSVAFAEYGTPTTEALSENVAKAIGNCDVAILQNHGAVAVGKSVMDAYYKMETLEHTCAISLYARLLGGEKTLNKQEADRLFEIRKSAVDNEPPGCVNCGKCSCIEAKKSDIPVNMDADRASLEEIETGEMKRYVSEIVRRTMLEIDNK